MFFASQKSSTRLEMQLLQQAARFKRRRTRDTSPSSAAAQSTVVPPPRVFELAPASRRRSATLTWPLLIARINAVLPPGRSGEIPLSLASTSAPAAKRTSITLECPFSAACISALRFLGTPRPSRMFTSIPSRKSALTVCKSPYRAASKNLFSFCVTSCQFSAVEPNKPTGRRASSTRSL